MIRVIAGEFRGRRLKGPDRLGIRPAMGIVKEHIFGVLCERVMDADVLDLFCGTGSIGIEALSRGASHITFVDSWDVAVRLVRDNLAQLPVEERSTIVPADALRYVNACAEAVRTFDLIFVDPPFKYSQWSDLLTPLPALMKPGESTLIVQHLPDIPDAAVPAELERVKHKRFGANQISMYRTLET